MATIKTIKPAGGGDYTTLQAWENWADDQVSGDQWAECYTGGDMGPVIIQTWAATTSSVLYPKIYTNLDQRHIGKDDGTGAFINTGSVSAINNFIDYVRIEGIRVEMGSSLNAGIHINLGADNCLIDSNLIVANNQVSVDGIYCTFNVAYSTITIQNNLIYGYGYLSNGITVYSMYSNTGSMPSCYIYNNTLHNISGLGINLYCYLIV